MSDTTTNFGPQRILFCDGCERLLNDKEIDHGREGFGHEGLCCDCYNERMGAPRRDGK